MHVEVEVVVEGVIPVDAVEDEGVVPVDDEQRAVFFLLSVFSIFDGLQLASGLRGYDVE